jgi:hypothetical protein
MADIDRHAYVRELASLCRSLANGWGVREPVLHLIDAGEARLAVHLSGEIEIACPPLPPGLCASADNNAIEAVILAKAWACLAISRMPIGMQRRAVGALSLGTPYD